MQRKTRGLQRDPKTGIWQIDKVVRGVRICGSTGTRDLNEAELELARRVERVRAETTNGVRPPRTFREAATKYLEDYARKRSIGRDALALRELDPYIGDKDVSEIFTETIQPYVDERMTGKAPPPDLILLVKRRKKVVTWGYIDRQMAVVRRILNLCARLWRHENKMTWLATAPLLLPKPPEGARRTKRPPYPLTWDEQRLLFGELAAHTERMAMFGANTGTREDEICSLLWEWEHQVPSVGSVFVIPSDIVKNSLPRVVVLNDVAQAIIDAQRGKHATHVFCYAPPAKRGGRICLRRRLRNAGLVKRGQHLTDDEMKALAATLKGDTDWRPVTRMHTAAWRKARRRAAEKYKERFGREAPAGFRQVRVHDLKHTFGRCLRAADVQLEDRQDLLGHKNAKITTDYSQADLLRLKRLANLVNERRETSVLLRAVG